METPRLKRAVESPALKTMSFINQVARFLASFPEDRYGISYCNGNASSQTTKSGSRLP